MYAPTPSPFEQWKSNRALLVQVGLPDRPPAYEEDGALVWTGESFGPQPKPARSVAGLRMCEFVRTGLVQVYFGGWLGGSLVVEWDLRARLARAWFEADEIGGMRLAEIFLRWAEEENERRKGA